MFYCSTKDLLLVLFTKGSYKVEMNVYSTEYYWIGVFVWKLFRLH